MLWAASCPAASPWSLRAWQTEEGLPENAVTGVAQTSEGYLWIATHGGLARFDGIRFQLQLLPVPTLRNNVLIRGLLLGDDKKLWVALEADRGLVIGFSDTATNIYGAADGLPALKPLNMAQTPEGAAGGNLAAMLATTGPADGLEPEGADTNFSSRVSCAVDFYGAVNLLEYHDMKMFSKSRAEAPELYEKASPVNYVNPGDAPLLIAHGTLDTVVSIHQSESLAAAYKKAGVPYEFVIVPGAVHTFNLEPSQKDLRPVVMAFLAQHLKPEAKAAR